MLAFSWGSKPEQINKKNDLEKKHVDFQLGETNMNK